MDDKKKATFLAHIILLFGIPAVLWLLSEMGTLGIEPFIGYTVLVWLGAYIMIDASIQEKRKQKEVAKFREKTLRERMEKQAAKEEEEARKKAKQHELVLKRKAEQAEKRLAFLKKITGLSSGLKTIKETYAGMDGELDESEFGSLGKRVSMRKHLAVQKYNFENVGGEDLISKIIRLPERLGLPYSVDTAETRNGYIVYEAVEGLAEPKDFNKHRAAISRFLGADYRAYALDGVKVVLKRPPALPAVIEFNDQFLHPGHIFFGINVESQELHWIPLKKLTHFLVVGISGVGKSVFLNQFLQGLLYNLLYIERLYLVDLKGGVELFPYEKQSPKITVVYRYEKLAALMSEIVETMHERLEVMRDRGLKNWDRGLIFVIIDEYAQIQNQKPQTKEAKEMHYKLLADLNALSMLGRAAGVRLFAQLQKCTTDSMDSSFKNNLQSGICFRVGSTVSAVSVFGSIEDLPINPMNIKEKGRFVMYDDASGKTVYLQSALVSDGFRVKPYEPKRSEEAKAKAGA